MCWPSALAAVAAYSALMVFYVPLPMSDATRATRLHLLGMWLTFAVSALMIAWFVVRMTRLIRVSAMPNWQRAREQALRDERIMAIGTLAAGAAHELGTPLATMSLLAGELASDPQLPTPRVTDIAPAAPADRRLQGDHHRPVAPRRRRAARKSGPPAGRPLAR